jgi:hypothetical protein
VHSRITSRAAAILVASALTIGSLGATVPAFAADVSSAASAPVANLTGFVTEVGDAAAESTTKLFRVVGHGYLRVDFAGVELGKAAFSQTGLDIAIPSGVTTGTTTASIFAALSAYNESGKVLTALAVTPARLEPGTERMVSQTDAKDATHKIFAVLVNPKESTSTKAASDQTAAKVAATVTAASGYWSEQSAGVIDLALAGTVPFYKSKYSCKSDSGSDSLWREAAKKAASKIGYKDAYNSHLVLFFPASADTKCGGAIGLGTIGGGVNSGGLIWTVGTNSAIGIATLTHELGHNFSLGHANWADCGTISSSLDVEEDCTVRPYGDVMSVMGYGLEGKTGGSLSSASAIRSGIWADDSYDIAPHGTTGTYTLNAVSSLSGKRAVIVQDSSGVDYFVEFRNWTGRDAQLSDFGCAPYSGVYYDCAPSAPGIRVLRLQNYFDVKGFWGDDDYLVGRSVGGAKRVNYLQGESFTTGGIAVTVNSVSTDTATVTVSRAPIANVEAGTVDIGFSLSHDNKYRAGDVWTAFTGAGWISDDYTFQWERNGVAIVGATESNYTIQGTDVGAYIAVTVTGTAAGRAPVSKSDPLTDLGYGPISTGYLPVNEQGTVAVDNSAGPLEAVPADWKSGTTFTYQWYRDSAAISGARSATYALTSADRAKDVSVRVAATSPGYYAVTAKSVGTDYSLTSTARPTISGTAVVGSEFTVSDGGTYGPEDAVAGLELSHQWLRNGAKISGATGASYTATSLDYGKQISVATTAHSAGYVDHVGTSVATGKLGKGTIAGEGSVADVAQSGLVLTASPADGTVTETGVAYSYQWYRGSAKIAKATKSSYTLVTADYAKSISVRITVSKSTYTSRVLTSPAETYSVIPDAARPVITGDVYVTGVIEAVSREYSNGGVETAWQWYRNGKAISGATAATYTIAAADKGAALTVKVTATSTGYLPSVSTSAATQKVGTLLIAGASAPAAIAWDTATGILAAQSGIADESAKLSYQWLRNGVAISKATKGTYTPTRSDYGKLLSVRVTATKTNATTVVKVTDAIDVSVHAQGALVVSDQAPQTGLAVWVDLETITYTPSMIDSVQYQWYADGKAISGATENLLDVDATLKGKKLSIRVTAIKSGYLSSVLTSAQTAKVVVGVP